MFIGAHVSAAGGLENAPINGGKIGCEAIQFFSRPPQGGKPREITTESAEVFKKAMQENGIQAAYIHAPYFINLASSTTRIYEGSIAVLREELERGSLLGCKAMMFHPGSAKDVGEAKGEEMVINGLNRILEGYTGSCQFLIEISAGAGMVMGDTFEEISRFIKGSVYGNQIGVCFDTQHAFASGYDLRTKESLETTFQQFDAIVGLDKLVASHVNDSKIELGGHKDRHESLGEGLLGHETFLALTTYQPIAHIDLILETPDDSKWPQEINLLKKHRDQ